MNNETVNVPQISVIMSVKNGADCLDKSIQSILNQTLTDFEFIICDDGSTDKTMEVLMNYMESDKRIKVLQNTQSMGLAYSLNRCIEESRSDIIARQDADDASDITRLEKQYAFVQSHPEYAIVGTCWYNVLENGVKHPVDVPREPSARDQMQRGLYMHPSWMMRKSNLEKVGFYTVNKYTMRSQDYHLVMKVLGAGMKLYNMPEKLYYYTVDSETVKRSLNWSRVRGLMWIRWDSYKRNHFPLWCYVYVLKPLITNLIPRRIMRAHYNKVYQQE